MSQTSKIKPRSKKILISIGICFGLIFLPAFIKALYTSGQVEKAAQNLQKEPTPAAPDVTSQIEETAIISELADKATGMDEIVTSETPVVQVTNEQPSPASIVHDELPPPTEETWNPTPVGLIGTLDKPMSETISSLHTCEMKDWGVQFMCDFDWEVLEKGLKDFRIILSKNPVITLSWQKFDKEIRFLGQLNHFFFEKSKTYREGFQTERVEFAGRDAVLVKGYSKDDPDIQMRDYYYLHNNQLLGVFFRLSPAERWEEGNSVIKKVKDSFAKLD